MGNVARVEATISAKNALRPGLSSAARDLDKFRAAQTKATRAFAASAAQFKGLERMERVMGTLQKGAVALGGFYALQRAGQAVKEATVRFAEVDRAMTRTGITGDAMAEEVRKGTEELRNLSRNTATLFDPAQKGLDAITASGRDFGDAMKMMPSVLKTAQASGAGVEEIANSSTALLDHMKISIEGLAEAQDTLAMGGKLGKFELKDMARYLPSMLPAFKALGQTGQDGLRKLVAMLQVIRSGTGTAEEAAASAQNIFSKMESEQTVKNFKEMGVDLPKAFAKARKEGKDLMQVFLQLSNKALKGDLSKLPQLFQDMEVQRGMRPLLDGLAKIAEYEDKLRGAKGTIDTDFKRVIADTQAQLDQFKEGADRAKAAFGGLAGELGSPLIKQGAENLDAVAQALERATQAAREGGAGAAVKQIVGELTDKVVKDVAEGRGNMEDLQQRYDDERQLARMRQRFDSKLDPREKANLEDEAGRIDARLKDMPAGAARDRLQAKREALAGQLMPPRPDMSEADKNAWSRDQMRKVDAEGEKKSKYGLYRSGPLAPLTSAADDFANAIEGAREARRAAAFSRQDEPVERSTTATKPGAAQRGRVQPPARPKAIGATAFPGYGSDDVPATVPAASVSTPQDRQPPASAKPGFKNDTSKLPQNPQGSAASNSLFSGERLTEQAPDPRLTKTAAMPAAGAFSPPPNANGLGEVQSKVDAAKASVESLGSSGASAGSALASGISSGLSAMEAQVAASVARMQQHLNSLKAPSLSMGGLGGFNTGKGMAEVK